MFIQSLQLKKFRSVTDRVFRFTRLVTLLVGPNASGKSTVVEAIDLLSTGRSFRASKVDEMIKFDQDLARVRAIVLPSTEAFLNQDLAQPAQTKTATQSGRSDKQSPSRSLLDKQSSSKQLSSNQSGGTNAKANLVEVDKTELSLLLTHGQLQGKRTHKLLFSVNGNRRRRKDFVGKFLSVVFRPEDLRLVEGSPSRRRDYINKPLSLVDQYYDQSLSKYHQALKRRNKLLSLIKDGQQKPSVLKYWDLALIKHGEKLQAVRKKFFQFINQHVEPPLSMKIKYQPSLMTEERLDSHRSRAMRAGFTLIGPHKDDFQVLLDFASTDSKKQREQMEPVDVYGSRGQKRLAVLWLKIAELQFLETKTEKRPVLLLDDILSELDEDYRELVLQLLSKGQSIITTTHPELKLEISQKLKGQAGVINQIKL